MELVTIDSAAIQCIHRSLPPFCGQAVNLDIILHVFLRRFWTNRYQHRFQSAVDSGDLLDIDEEDRAVHEPPTTRQRASKLFTNRTLTDCGSSRQTLRATL